MTDARSSKLPPRPILCPACRYDLRGIDSDVCPECGRPRIWRLVTYSDIAEYSAARHALHHAGIPHEEYQHFGGLEGATALVGGRAERFTIGLGLPQIESAARVLEEAGLPLPLIIIERANPFCDVCNADLTHVTDGVCPRCHTAFAWDDELDFEAGLDPDSAAQEP